MQLYIDAVDNRVLIFTMQQRFQDVRSLRVTIFVADIWLALHFSLSSKSARNRQFQHLRERIAVFKGARHLVNRVASTRPVRSIGGYSGEGRL